MECPKCGYVMGPFDVECERCKRMGRSDQPAPLPPKPAPTITQLPRRSPAEPPPPRRVEPEVRGERPWAAIVFGICIVLSALGYLGDCLMDMGSSSIARLDGQHISVRAHCTELRQDGPTWTGVIVIDEGPLKGAEFDAIGLSDGSFGAESRVRVAGTVRVRPDGNVGISPMTVQPE